LRFLLDGLVGGASCPSSSAGFDDDGASLDSETHAPAGLISCPTNEELLDGFGQGAGFRPVFLLPGLMNSLSELPEFDWDAD
jgi:hypothetical protein